MLFDMGRWLSLPLVVMALGQVTRGVDTASATTPAQPVAIYQTVDPDDSRRLVGFIAELDADAGSAVLGRWDLDGARWVHCDREAPARYRCETPWIPRGATTALVQPLPGRQ
ncbi:MAG: hypothetical protein EPO65_07790 [Dehalococcoidia bacterium]|nr:MAG: hypothetical protein EPO65_07790 [Dehalococcoidia bacterium]